MPDAQDESNNARSTFRAFLELLRLPNVFTAAADVMMGFLVVQGTFQDYSTLARLVLTSCCLYLMGMVFNDLYDRQIDAKERPERPIPSGRVSLGVARLTGVVLLCIGLVLPMQVSWQHGLYMPFAVAWGLALLVILYDKWLKHTMLGPVAMGGCRFLNVFLGMSLMTDSPSAMQYLIAGGVGVYVMGITLFARGEAEISNRTRLMFGVVVMLVGIAMLAISPRFIGENQEWRLAGTPAGWPYFWLLFSAHVDLENVSGGCNSQRQACSRCGKNVHSVFDRHRCRRQRADVFDRNYFADAHSLSVGACHIPGTLGLFNIIVKF